MKLKDWTLFEKILLIGSIIVASLTDIIFKSGLLTVTCSIVGMITALFTCKR